VVAWQVKYGTKLSPIVLPTSKWQMLLTQALQFAVVAKQWEERVFFNIVLFKSGSVAGAVKNQTLAFFANICEQHRNF